MEELLAAVIAHVYSVLEIPVSSEVPAEKPSAFVTIGPSGGTFDRFVQQPLYSVSAYAGSDAEAAALLRDACDAMLTLPDALDLVCQSSVQTTYRDDLEDMSGWTATVSVLANRD